MHAGKGQRRWSNRWGRRPFGPTLVMGPSSMSDSYLSLSVPVGLIPSPTGMKMHAGEDKRRASKGGREPRCRCSACTGTIVNIIADSTKRGRGSKNERERDEHLSGRTWTLQPSSHSLSSPQSPLPRARPFPSFHCRAVRPPVLPTKGLSTSRARVDGATGMGWHGWGGSDGARLTRSACPANAAPNAPCHLPCVGPID